MTEPKPAAPQDGEMEALRVLDKAIERALFMVANEQGVGIGLVEQRLALRSQQARAQGCTCPNGGAIAYLCPIHGHHPEAIS